jgi:hypothetical protein
MIYDVNQPRIINKKNVPLDTSYDLVFKADKNITTETNGIEMLRFLLPKQLGITLKEISLDTIAHFLIIREESLLYKSRTQQPFFATSIRYENWEATGARLLDLKNFLENNYGLLIEGDFITDDKYNFILPVNNLTMVKEQLETNYGIIFVDKEVKTKFWILE